MEAATDCVDDGLLDDGEPERPGEGGTGTKPEDGCGDGCPADERGEELQVDEEGDAERSGVPDEDQPNCPDSELRSES